MNTIERQVVDSALGLVGGAVATVLMQQGMKAAPKLPESIRPEPPSRDPGDFVVEKAEQVLSRPLSEKAHATSAKLSHYVYGATWGAGLGFAYGGASAPIRRSARLILVGGAAMGALCWAAGYLGWLPATGLTKPVTQQKPGGVANGFVSHVLYGIVAAAPIAAKAMMLSPRRRIRRLFRF